MPAMFPCASFQANRKGGTSLYSKRSNGVSYQCKYAHYWSTASDQLEENKGGNGKPQNSRMKVSFGMLQAAVLRELVPTLRYLSVLPHDCISLQPPRHDNSPTVPERSTQSNPEA
jgi:hypothetical protein